MKYNNLFALFILFLFLAFTSCDKKEDYTGYSIIKASDAKATLSFNPPASIVEQDTTFNFVVTLDKPQAADIHIYISQTGGTAEEGTDFDFSHDIVIPAYSTSAAGELKIYGDDEIEETETFTLSIGDNRTANVNYTSQSFTVELLNAVQPKLDLTFDWGGEVMVDGAAAELCDSVDIDIYVFDVEENDLGIYGAATGACPEHLTLEGLDDGDYYLWANLYINNIRPTSGDPIAFPISITATQPGLFENQMYEQTSENIITSADPDVDTDGGNTFKPVVKVTIANGGNSYTITPL